MTAKHPQRRVGSELILVEKSDEGTERPAILLFPGLGSTSRIWQSVVAAGLRDYDIVHCPSVGLGSAARRDLQRLKDLGAAVAEQISQLHYRDFLAVSHSLGGLLAIEVALSLGDRVGGLVLANGGLEVVGNVLDRPLAGVIRKPRTGAALAALLVGVCLPGGQVAARWIGRSRVASRIILGPYADAIVTNDVDARSVMLETIGHPQLLRNLVANRHYWQRAMRLAPMIRQPVVVLAGCKDPLAGPRASECFVRRFEEGACRAIPGMKHSLPLEAPEVIIRAVRIVEKREELICGNACC